MKQKNLGVPFHIFRGGNFYPSVYERSLSVKQKNVGGPFHIVRGGDPSVYELSLWVEVI